MAGYQISFSVAAIVRRDVNKTSTSAGVAQPGQSSLFTLLITLGGTAKSGGGSIWTVDNRGLVTFATLSERLC